MLVRAYTPRSTPCWSTRRDAGAEDFTDRRGGQAVRVLNEILEDEAESVTGENRDGELYRIEFEDGRVSDFRWRDLRPPIE